MYLGITRVGSLSVADTEVEEPTTSGRPVDDRVDSLISRIRPARHSEQRRHRVAKYVSSLITRCFQVDHEVEAFMFGSVPLKTYLPDGDIDLSVFQSKGNSLRDSWTTKLCLVLEDEQRDPCASFRVRDVQVIHAEVKLLKCLVDNIVVDISFETLGGLCTVAFLESIDRHVKGQHLFKRSVILVKAWCYYESRLLGAHHGLISTYALETMVLYIFNFHHKDLKTPCQVLHKFLQVFSQFDWDKYCLSLQGPIILSSFPNPKVEQPAEVQKGSLLMSEEFTDEMMELYSPVRHKQTPDSKPVMPQTSRSFPVKFLNIMDPLLPTNNLGRSVSKASFARIRKALAHGAKSLSGIVAKDEADAVSAVDKFFKNTWNAQRPVASKQAQQGMYQQPAASWQGNKQMHGYNSPILSIPPEQFAQYLQQYQHQRMLQHLHHQQQQQQYQQHIQHVARHQQHVQRSDSGQMPTSVATSIHPPAHPSVNLSQYHAQQQQQQHQQQQRPVALASTNGSIDPPARSASPSISHAQTGSSDSDSISHPGTTASASDALPSLPLAADTAADSHAATAADTSRLDNVGKTISARPLQPDAFTGPLSAPSAAVGSTEGQAADPMQPNVAPSHSVSDPPSITATHEPPSTVSGMPPAVAMPAADAITAAQGGQAGHPPSRPSADGLPAGAPPQHGPLLGQPVPPLMMPSMQFPGQAYGVPMPVASANGRDVFPYGGMLMPMMPGMMLPPPPQQQTRAGRGNRANAVTSNAAGNVGGKWVGHPGQQQAALEQLFPDMRPQIPQPPPLYQHQPPPAGQQPPQLIAAAAPSQQADDILAGDIEQLNSHLHAARFCSVHKTAPPAAPPAADGSPADQPAGPLLTSNARSNPPPQTGQHARSGANGFAPLQDRSRPKERHDRWPGPNGVYPSGRLAQSNSPPMTPAYPQSHGMQVPAHLLQHQFPGHVFMPPSRDMRHSQHQRQAYMHAQPHQHQQPAAMPSWQPQPLRVSSIDDMHSYTEAAAAAEAGNHHTAAPVSQPHPPPISAPPPVNQDQLLAASNGNLASQGWEAAASSNLPLPPVNSAQLPTGTALPPFHGGPAAAAAFHGPASVDSPPAPKGIWGDGLHQQRLSNLANDLAHVRVAEAPAASNVSTSRKDPAPSSSRSAGSTPHAGDTHRARGNFPFDSTAALNKRRQRLPHNASAHELGQSASGSTGPEAPAKRDRAAKLSLDSLTSQAEAAQRQQALAFELNTADFPALGGMAPGPSIPASPAAGLGAGNWAPHAKARSETDALSPSMRKSLPE